MNDPLAQTAKSLEKKKYPNKKLKKNNSNHLLVSGDCSDVCESISDNSIDLIITDPPYNQGIDYGKGFNDKKTWLDYYSWINEKLRGLKRILSNEGSLYIISYPEINARILPFLEDEMNLILRRWITWHYPTNIGHSKKNFTRSQRSILFFSKTMNHIFNREHLRQHYKNPKAKVVRKRLKDGHKGRTSYDLLRFLDIMEIQEGLIDVLDINLLKNVSKDRYRNLNSKFETMTKEQLKKFDHPCQLPITLLELLVRVGSNKDSIVLDPFAGTFTTSVAAMRNGRNSIGIELNQDYMNFGYERMKSDKAQNVSFEGADHESYLKESGIMKSIK